MQIQPTNLRFENEHAVSILIACAGGRHPSDFVRFDFTNGGEIDDKLNHFFCITKKKLGQRIGVSHICESFCDQSQHRRLRAYVLRMRMYIRVTPFLVSFVCLV